MTAPHPPGYTEFSSEGVALVEVTMTAADNVIEREPLTAERLLHLMRARIPFYGSPLPAGFVPPPGIDLDALLKEIPWPPPSDA